MPANYFKLRLCIAITNEQRLISSKVGTNYFLNGFMSEKEAEYMKSTTSQLVKSSISADVLKCKRLN